MDVDYRALERAEAEGDPSATCRLARATERAGRPALSIWTRALAQAPTSEDAKLGYIGSRGFYPERVEDEHLGDAFRYYNVNVNGELHTIVQGNDFLERGDARTWDQWRTYASRNKKGIKITSAPLEASIKLGWFSLREHPAFREDLQHYLASHRRNETSWPIFGKLTYAQDNNATLEDYAMNCTIQTKPLQLPTFNQNHSTLAPEQLETQLGRVTFNEQSEAATRQLFGIDPSPLTTAFQYFTARRTNGNLREVRLWTPPTDDRQQHPERALVLGDGGGGFGIDCGGDVGYGRPALGWSSARKKSP